MQDPLVEDLSFRQTLGQEKELFKNFIVHEFKHSLNFHRQQGNHLLTNVLLVKSGQ